MFTPGLDRECDAMATAVVILPAMESGTIEQTLQAAVDHHRAGRLAEAEALYLHVLGRQPQNATALHRIGIIAFQVGKMPEAVNLISRAIQIDPAAAQYYNDLGAAQE